MKKNVQKEMAQMPESKQKIRNGDIVSHPTFGRGTVILVEEKMQGYYDEDGAHYTMKSGVYKVGVLFDNGETKEIVSSFLKKVGTELED